MTEPVDIAAVGALVGDRVRAAILTSLLSGEERSASALADAAGASASLASAHLRKLLDGGLIVVESHGRERRYRLAGPVVAEMLEAMQLVAPAHPTTSLRGANAKRRIRRARLCYDHLAGVLGMAVTEGLIDRGALQLADGSLVLGRSAEPVLAEIGVDLDALRAADRPLLRDCLDLTERRRHLSGGLGAAVAHRLLADRWVVRREGGRGVDLTVDGAAGLHEWLAIDLATNAAWHEATAHAMAHTH